MILNMKTIIMAAGKGTRMLPLTEKTQKVLIPVNGKPFLYYIVESLKKAGFDEFGIIAGHLKEQIEEFVVKEGINAKIIEQKEQLGSGHALLQAKEFANGESVLVICGDNLFSVEDLKEMNKRDDMNYIIGCKVENPSKYGVLITNGDKLIKIIEKPKEFVGNFVNVGLYKFTPEIWDVLPKLEKSVRGEYELVDAVTTLAKAGKVKVLKMKDYWLDFGCLEDIPKVEAFLKNNNL